MENSIRFIAFIFIVLTFSCSDDNSVVSESAFKSNSTIVTDDLGRTITIDKTPQRVISLAPSITEILYFIEADSQIVARTQACDFPEECTKLPVVSTYPLDIESIVKLNPDLVISVDGIVNADQLKKLEELGIKVFFQKYETIEDINESIIVLGNILGKGKKASSLVEKLKVNLEKLKTSSINPLQALMITWTKPIYVYGLDTPFSDKIKFAGGENAMKEILNSPYPEITREYLLKLNPDVLLGGSFEQMDSTFFTLYPELKTIKAYQKKQIFDVDDNLMSRPSPRYVESIVELKEILSKCK